MAWKQFIITAPTPLEAESITDSLESFGALAVTQSSASKQEIFEPDLNTTPLWQETTITALFPLEVEEADLLAALHQQHPNSVDCRYYFEQVDDEAWERKCLDQFQAMDFGNNLWICPSWVAPPNPLADNLILDPGLAFGTGTHPTTRLCLEWIAATPMQNKVVLDYGCGSGILAIACAIRGAKRVWAVDIDPQAITATMDNCERNQIPETQLQAMLDTQFKSAQHDILIANILAVPLVSLAPKMAELTKSGALIALSGILKEQWEKVAVAYQPWFEIDPPVFLHEWTRITAVRR